VNYVKVNNDVSTAQKLAFSDCSYGIRIATGIDQLFIWTASVTLAFKYQLVASNIEHYITGNINSQRQINYMKMFFAGLWILSIIYFIVYIVFSNKEKGGAVLKKQ